MVGAELSISVSKRDVLWSYAGTCSTMLVNLALLPVMIKLIDADSLGLWYVYSSIGGLVTLFDFGFNPTMARNVAYCWSGAKSLTKTGKSTEERSGEPNFGLLRQLVVTCRVLYGIITVAAALAIGIAGTMYVMKLAGNLDMREVVVSWVLYVASILLSLYYGYFAILLRGVGAVRQYYQIMTFARCAQFVISVALMLVGMGIVAAAAAYFTYGLLLRLLSKHAFYRYESIGERLKRLLGKTTPSDVGDLFRTMWYNAWRDGLVSLSAYLATQATVLVASAFLTLAQTGVYSISVQLINAVMTLSSVAYTAQQPAMQAAFYEDNRDKLKSITAETMVTYLLVYTVLLVGLVTVGAPVLSIIKPGTTFDAAVILCLGCIDYFYKRMQLYASFISNMNTVPYMPAFIVSSAAGILLSAALMDAGFGVWGLLAGQGIPQLIYNCWRWPKYVYDYLEVSHKQMLKLGVKGLLEKRG
jgi:O-antigen/teichoic acid export membrane protein